MTRRGLQGSLGWTALIAGLMAPVAGLAAEAAAIAFDLPAGPLDDALAAYAAQSGEQLLYNSESVSGARSPGLKGRMTPSEALRRLAGAGGLEVQRTGPNVVVLKPRSKTVGSRQAIAPAGSDALEALAPTVSAEVEALVVTGTLIRGAGSSPSPLIVLDRDTLDRSGYATVAEALQALPQNFGGTGTPTTALTSADPTGSNSYFSTGVNLRGLGNDATLVLVNGRRLAGTGYKGDFADLSGFPTAAIERVDILLDGASALYGSDAVGGVVNVVLKRDFEGMETRARTGTAHGGAEELQIAHTAGWGWKDGHALVSYEYHRRGSLGAGDRAYTASPDLRPFGGTDLRSNFGHPGNIMVPNPGGGTRVGWAIPGGQNGVGLLPSDFLAGQANRGNNREGGDLLPEERRHSFYAFAEQSLGERVTLSGDLRYSERRFEHSSGAPVATLTVNRSNPFFVSPNGSSSHQIAYSFYDEVGPTLGRGKAEHVAVSLGATAELFGDWQAEVYGAFSQERSPSEATNFINSFFLREALGTIPDDPRTAYSAPQDGYFNPFGDTGANSQAVLDFISSGYTEAYFRTRVSIVNAVADGSLLELPGGPLKAAVGFHARREGFLSTGRSLRSVAVPSVRVDPEYERRIFAGFAEVRAPLVGPENDVAGVHRLEVSSAARFEDYDDVGSTINPKVGLIYMPFETLTLRASYGRSFRAPALAEIYDRSQSSATPLPTADGGQVVSLYLYGGNRDLEPETAKSLNLGLDYRPDFVPGLALSATVFDIRYKDRIDQPVLLGLNEALTNPAFASFVERLDPARPADLARIQALLGEPSYTLPGVYPAEVFGAIVNARYVNATALRVTGLDLSGRYDRTLGPGRLEVSGNLSYLWRHAFKLTPDASPLSILDTAGNPIDLRARIAADWSQGDFRFGLSGNYVDDYRDAAGRRIDGWTTFDLQAAWVSPARSGPLRGLTLTATVRNLLDEDPPFYNAPSPQAIGYDAANADPFGRYVALQLAKRW